MIDFSKLKILILDDDAVVTDILYRMLDDLGVKTKEKFQDAVAATAALENFTPNVILSDIDMAGIDGFQFVRDARHSHPQVNQAAVVFLTGHSDPGFIHKAKELRVAGYLLKPINYDKLRASLVRVYNALLASGRL